MSGTQTLTTQTYAVVSTNLDLHVDTPPSVVPGFLIGDAKVTADPLGDTEVFIGIAPTAQAERYLGSVERALLTRIVRGDAVLDERQGGAPAAVPTQTDIWAEQSSGVGSQTIVWEPRSGDWTVVVMNADGSAGVTVDVAVGAQVPAVGWVIGVLLVVMVVALLVGIVLIALPLRAVAAQPLAR